jgi:peroxiredoxin
MTSIIERFMDFICATIVTLNVRCAGGASTNNVLMRKRHGDRRSDLNYKQNNGRNPPCDGCVHQSQCSKSDEKETTIRLYCISNEEPLSLSKHMTKSTLRTIVLCISFLIPGLRSEAQAQIDLKIGDPAPGFTLPYATKDSIARTTVSLSNFAGNRVVVLAFYPADWSTGCTKEVCAMRDNFLALQALNAEILAVSGDYVWSHHEWAKALDLPFKLLSDHAHAVAKLYNSFNEKSMYNRRTVFIIDKQGRIAYTNTEYSVADSKDLEQLRTALEATREVR